ncbi:MAG: 5'/3'-nucleotidase SurE [Verrucomicrobia bacterium]|nr:5'/3'-nucleotidase SurE [Verrucomicrobiota bacterium]
MRILISNDDGIYSPGILALAEAAAQFGEVRIVAPDVEQSSMGAAITASRPLRFRKTPINRFDAYRVNGTPSDCVALGLHLWGGADLVLSGINLGSNLGNSAWHSGTLAAAKQAVLLGTRGIALSTPVDDTEPDFTALESSVTRVLQLLVPLQQPRLLNVNLPVNAKGVKWTRQSVRHYDGRIIADKDPRGREHFWFTVIPLERAEKDTDRWAVENGWISITPLRLDLTDETALSTALASATKEGEAPPGGSL